MTSAPWQAVAALVDPVRRGLYDYVRRQEAPTSREQAADAQRISRHLAAFHLDKLVEAGLLEARYEAPQGQARGRGRTPKVYLAAGGGLSLMIPERRYELIAGILADAVAAHPENAQIAAHRQARSHGRRCGERLTAVTPMDALAGLGFEPEQDAAGRILLANCPFHALAVNQPELVCGLNHAFIDGLLAGLGVESLTPRLAPRPGACCVELSRVSSIT